MVGCWCGCLSGARCRFAYGPADATATRCLFRRRYEMLHNFRFIDDVMCSHNGPYGGRSIPLQRVTLLRRCVQANAPAAWYWLQRVLDNGERRDLTSLPCQVCRGRSLQCTCVQLFVFQITQYAVIVTVAYIHSQAAR